MGIRKEAFTSRPTVLVVGLKVPPAGGMQTYLEDQLRSMLGQKYRLVVHDVRKRTPENRPFWTGIVSQLKLFTDYMRKLIFDHPSIVHIHTSSWLFFYLRSCEVLLARLFRVPVVLHIHGASFHHFLNQITWTGRRYTQLILHFSNRVIVLSELWKRHLLARCSEHKIRIVPNGIETRIYLEGKNTPETDGVCTALFVGSLGTRKGVYDILYALEDQRLIDMEFKVVFVGDFETERDRKNIEKRCLDEKLLSKVVFTGPLFGEDKVKWFQKASFLLFPSHNENFPIVMIEAMAAGLPIVISDVGAIPEVLLEEKNALMVEPGDREGLVKAIYRMVSEPELRKRMSCANREKAKCFDFAESAKCISRIYQELLKRKLVVEHKEGIY